MNIRSMEEVDGLFFVEFYVTIFNVAYSIFLDTDEYKEMVLPTAFDEWLADPKNVDRVVHLLDHKEACGIVEKIYSDNIGLIVRAALLPENEYGDIALSHYQTAKKLGKTVKHSIGFFLYENNTGSDYEYNKTLNCYVLKRAKLFDVSTITKWAANPNAIDIQRALQLQNKEEQEQKEINQWNFLNSININL